MPTIFMLTDDTMRIGIKIPMRLYISMNMKLCLNNGQQPPIIIRKLKGGMEKVMGTVTTTTSIQDIEI